MLKIDDVLTKE